MATTSRLSLRYPVASDTADVPRDIGNLASDIDDAAIFAKGTFAARPTSTVGSPGIEGRFYFATDTARLYLDRGTEWQEVASGVNSINKQMLADGAVGTDEIEDGAVFGSKLAANGIDSTKLINGAVTTAKIDNGAVGTNQLADGAVYGKKLAAGGITSSKLDGSIGNFGNWIAYTPTFTAVTTNPTLGTGGTTQGYYVQIGRTVIGYATATFGSSGVDKGSGAYRLSLPRTARTNTQGSVGNAIITDAGVQNYGGSVYLVSTTKAGAFNQAFTGLVGHESPITFGANDDLTFSFTYEAASSL